MGVSGGGDKAGALILNQYRGPRCVWPERLSSTNMGSQVRGLNLKKTEDGSGDKAAALILNQYGGFRLRKTEVGARPERLSSTNMGVQVRGLNLKKTEAGTRPERLPSTNMGVPGAYGRSAYPQPIRGSQVRGLNLKRRRRGQGRSAYPQPTRGDQKATPTYTADLPCVMCHYACERIFATSSSARSFKLATLPQIDLPQRQWQDILSWTCVDR